MTTKFGTLSMEVCSYCDRAETLIDIEKQLDEAARDAGIEDHRFFYDTEKDVFGIRIPLDESDIESVLWVGGFLGICHNELSNSEGVRIERLRISIAKGD
jgi:hypothetical protein